MGKKFVHAVPVGQILPHKLRIEGQPAALMAQLGALLRQPGPEQRLVHGLPQVGRRLTGEEFVAGLHHHVGLQPLLGGQEHVGIGGEGGGRGVHVDDQVHVLNGGQPALAVGHRAQLIAGTVDPRLDRVGLAGDHGVPDAGGMPRKPDVQALVLVGAQALFQLFLGQHPGGDGHRVVGHIEQPAGAEALEQRAGTLHIAHEQVDGGRRHGRLDGVGALVGGHSDGQAAGAVVGEEPDGPFDPLRVQPAQLGRLLQGIRLHPLPQKLEAGLAAPSVYGERPLQRGVQGVVPGIGQGAGTGRLLIPDHKRVGLIRVLALLRPEEHLALHVHQIGQVGPLAHKVPVKELMLQDVPDPGEHQGHVAARPDGQPHVGLGGVRGHAGVDDHGLDPLGPQVADHAAAAGGAGVGGGRPPEHQGLDGGLVGEVELQRVGIGNAGIHPAVHHGVGQHPGQIALGAARLEPVGRAEDVAEAGDAPDLRVAAAAGGAGHRLRSVLLPHLHQALCDVLQRLVPGGAAPLVFPPLARADERILVAVGVIEGLDARQALGAHAPLAHRILRVALELDHPAVAHRGQHAAVGDAGPAAGLDDPGLVRPGPALSLQRRKRRRVVLCLAQAPDPGGSQKFRLAECVCLHSPLLFPSAGGCAANRHSLGIPKVCHRDVQKASPVFCFDPLVRCSQNLRQSRRLE